MPRKKHPKPEIEAAVQYAERKGWTCEKAGDSAYAWGKLKCPYNDKVCRCGKFCQNSIWSTPRSPSNHAKAIKKWVDNCVHVNSEEGEDSA